MRTCLKRSAALLFALCLCFTMLFFMPARADAESLEVRNVLASLNYPPVVYMELKYVNVSTSGTGYYITGAGWVKSDGTPETTVFGRGTYQLQISYAVNEGYHFAADARGFINNSPEGVSLTVSADGTTALLTKTFEAEIWAPVAIKDPGNAVVDVGGWTSFVVSSMYTDVDEWYMQDPNGKIYPMKEAAQRFSGITYSGENTDKLILRNIPADMNGWSVFCRHWSVDRISYSDSKRGSITVKGPSPTPAPTPSPTPEPTPAPTPVPEESAAAEGTDAAEGGDAASAPVEQQSIYLETWSQDGNYHWHDSKDGSLVSGKAPHSFVWRERLAPTADAKGEEEGVCSICGYTTTRTLEATGSTTDLNSYRPLLYLVGGAVGLGVIGAVAAAVLSPGKKKKRK